MPRLLLVRHCQSEYNLAGRFAGSGSDIDLSEGGRRQAAQLLGRLASEKIDVIFSSKMKRALVTANTIATSRNLDVVLCPELGEINYGLVEGKTFDEVQRDYPEIARQILEADPEISFPGGERFTEFTDRTCRFLDRIPGFYDSQTILVVAHGGTVRTLVCRLLDIDINRHWSQFRVDNASLTILETGRHGVIISLFNDTAYLR